jgi:hypothetical protein
MAAAGTPAAAQAEIQISLPLEPAIQGEGPLVRATNVLGSGNLQELIRSGFPARLRYRVELWSVGRFVNEVEGTYAWDVVVRYEPLDRNLHVARLIGDRVYQLGQYSTFRGADSAVARALRVPLSPDKGGRFYYTALLEVETLSLNDLDEVERWLRGDLRPAVRGERSPGTALGRGLRKLTVRLLGAERLRLETRSSTFRL